VSRRKRKKREHDALEAYRGVRRPMPPPERVIPDEREKLRRQEAEREILLEPEIDGESIEEPDAEPRDGREGSP
jgi:hypothetical protein